MSTRIKFCGATTWSDVELAIESGADAVGMIFAPSPRRIAMDEARAIAARIAGAISTVGVFVDPTHEEIEGVRELFPQMSVQLSGNESPEFADAIRAEVIKVLHVEAATSSDLETACARYPRARILFDTRAQGTYGGTGLTFDWTRVARLARSHAAYVAGGLTPENVGHLVRTVRPFGVDVRSGIETNGHKDARKMRAFVEAVRSTDAL